MKTFKTILSNNILWIGFLFICLGIAGTCMDNSQPAPERHLPPLHIVIVNIDGKVFPVPVLATNLSIEVR